MFLKILAPLIGTEFVTLAVTTSEKNIWMMESEILSKESMCTLKAIKHKFYPKAKYFFCLPGLLRFMKFYLDFHFLLL